MALGTVNGCVVNFIPVNGRLSQLVELPGGGEEEFEEARPRAPFHPPSHGSPWAPPKESPEPQVEPEPDPEPAELRPLSPEVLRRLPEQEPVEPEELPLITLRRLPKPEPERVEIVIEPESDEDTQILALAPFLFD